MAPRKRLPSAEQPKKEMPDAEQSTKRVQKMAEGKKLPPIGNIENVVTIGGKEIEIKPTKLKYQRNRTAAFYKILDVYPLADVMAMESGAFGDDRDGDKATMDWLIAVTDDEELIINNYDEMTTDAIEKMLVIFKRVNKIDEKEDKLKNLERIRKGAA